MQLTLFHTGICNPILHRSVCREVQMEVFNELYSVSTLVERETKGEALCI